MRKTELTNLAHALTGFITSMTMAPSESTNFPPIKLGTFTYRNPRMIIEDRYEHVTTHRNTQMDTC